MSPLATEDLMIIGPPGADLDPRRSRDIVEFAEAPMVLYRAPNHLRWLVEIALRGRGLRPFVPVEVDSLAMMLDLVRRATGYSIMPRCVVADDIAAGRVAAAPARGMTVTWTVAINEARPPSPAAKRLERLLRDTARERIGRGEWQAALRA